MPETDRAELLRLTEQLLESIATKNWDAYEQLCDASLTCFEPEARGHLVEGLAFHRFYFEREGTAAARNTTICSPHVRVMGDVAVVSYVRLTQSASPGGDPATTASEESRVWRRGPAGWRMVHFHRSACP